MILLPSALGRATPDPSLWGAPIGGVPLLQRQARILRAAGAKRVTLIGTEAESAAMAGVSAGPFAVDDVKIDVVAPEDGQDAVGDRVAGAAGVGVALLLDAASVFERGAVKRFAEAARAGVVGLAVDGRPAALAAVGAGNVADGLAWIGAAARGEVAPGGVDRIAHEPAKELVGVARDDADRQTIEHELWERCRKPIDGFVSRNLNRHISLFISRRIAHLGITPNHISVFTMVLGLTGAFLAAQGTYGMVVLGAVLLKLNSILDGVDGELARMRIQASVLGEWLDTISDDLSNQTFFAGVGVGAYAMTGEALWLWLAVAAVGPLFLTSALYYTWLAKMGRGDVLVFDWFKTTPRTAAELAARTVTERVSDVLTMLFRRDAFVAMLLVMALGGVVEYSLFVVAPAAWITFLALLWRTLRKDARAAPPDEQPAVTS